MKNSMGFWGLLSIVIGSQIGSGIFMLPAVLSPYGIYSLVGWVISAIGAISIAFVFSLLSRSIPKTGGPHVYVEEAFGRTTAFFTGWGYWMISWVSTVVVIVASIGYLSPLLKTHNTTVYLTLEILLLVIITLINMRGADIAGKAEFVLNLFKLVPLLILPICALYFFNSQNFIISNHITQMPITNILGQVTLLTMWGFIGVESGTTPAGSVKNPKKNIPLAIIIGTSIVALVYFINSLGIIGLIPKSQLETSMAPYVDATKILLNGNWYIVMSIIASLVCVGALNAWVLTSSQIMLGLAEDKLVPKFFVQKNKYGAPVISIMASTIGLIILLIFTSNENFAKQIYSIVDFSVTAFLFVYLICGIAAIKIYLDNKVNFAVLPPALISILFCSFIIYKSSLYSIFISILFIISGLPIYLFWYRKQNQKMG